MLTNSLAVAIFCTLAVALPAPLVKRAGAYSPDVQIHQSCNATQRRMLEQGFKETYEVATVARDYIYHHGAEDEIFQLYFGSKPEAYPAVVGVLDSVLNSNKAEVIFRCDNPDKNCNQPGWRGHYRGENATAETVICDASYTDRLYNAAFCMHGFDLSKDAPSVYWSIDLLHRLFHVPAVTNAAVNHYADDLKEVLELAVHNSTMSPFDSDAVQYFAAHVYAVEVAKGGPQCIGSIKAHEHTSDTTDQPAAEPPTQSTDANCHSHADGTIHCV